MTVGPEPAQMGRHGSVSTSSLGGRTVRARAAGAGEDLSLISVFAMGYGSDSLLSRGISEQPTLTKCSNYMLWAMFVAVNTMLLGPALHDKHETGLACIAQAKP